MSRTAVLESYLRDAKNAINEAESEAKGIFGETGLDAIYWHLHFVWKEIDRVEMDVEHAIIPPKKKGAQ
jgi:hypothetical protein